MNTVTLGMGAYASGAGMIEGHAAVVYAPLAEPKLPGDLLDKPVPFPTDDSTIIRFTDRAAALAHIDLVQKAIAKMDERPVWRLVIDYDTETGAVLDSREA